jgi:hypothetical protein
MFAVKFTRKDLKSFVLTLIVGLAAVMAVFYLIRPQSYFGLDQGECILTVATIGDYFLVGDNTGALSMSPPGVLNHNQELPLFTHWIRNLLYPPIVTYSVDELNRQTPPENFYHRYRSAHLDLDGFNNIDPSLVRQIQRTSSSYRYLIDFSSKAASLRCSDGLPMPTTASLARPIIALQDTLSKLGSITNDIRLYLDDDGGLVADIHTETGGISALYDLMLGHTHLFRTDLTQSNRFIGCGLFRLADGSEGNGIDVENQSITMVINPDGFGPKTYFPATCGMDEAGQGIPAHYCFKRYTSDTQITVESASYDILLASYNPYQSRGVPIPEDVVAQSLPVGTHYYAVINSQLFQDREERIALYRGLFIPAVQELLLKKVIENSEDIPVDYWFPRSWEMTLNVEAVTDIIDYKFGSLRGDITPLRDFKGEFRIILSGSENPPDPERNPLLREIISRLATLGIPESNVRLISGETATGGWPIAHMVLFTAKYDPIFGDPTLLLSSQAGNLRAVSPSANSGWEAKLQNASRRILISGPSSRDVLTYVNDVQKSLVNDAFLFPLFTVPYYVFTRKGVVNHMEMNYREGFINMDRWVVDVSSRCEGTK